MDSAYFLHDVLANALLARILAKSSGVSQLAFFLMPVDSR